MYFMMLGIYLFAHFFRHSLGFLTRLNLLVYIYVHHGRARGRGYIHIGLFPFIWPLFMLFQEAKDEPVDSDIEDEDDDADADDAEDDSDSVIKAEADESAESADSKDEVKDEL